GDERVPFAVERGGAVLESRIAEPTECGVEGGVEPYGTVHARHERVLGIRRQVDLAAVVGFEPPQPAAHLLDDRRDLGATADLAVAEHRDQPVGFGLRAVLRHGRFHVRDRARHARSVRAYPAGMPAKSTTEPATKSPSS